MVVAQSYEHCNPSPKIIIIIKKDIDSNGTVNSESDTRIKDYSNYNNDNNINKTKRKNDKRKIGQTG